jgi:tetratricopeptide (TPR) repeat protein
MIKKGNVLPLIFAISLILSSFLKTNSTLANETQSKDDLKLRFEKLEKECKKLSRTNPDSAFSLAMEALSISRSVKDSALVAHSYDILSKVEFFRRNYEQAENFGQYALSISDSINHPEIASSIYNNLAATFKVQQHFPKALEYYQHALSLRNKLKDTAEIIGSLINIGGLYSSMGNFEMSLEYYLHALEMTKNITDNHVLGSLNNNLAIAYKRLGDNKKALEYYFTALEHFRLMKWANAEANVLGNIGSLYSDMKEKADSALLFYNQAMQIHQKTNDRYGIGMTKINIALVFNDKGKLQQAIRLFEESIDIANQIKSTRLLDFAYSGIAESYEKSGNFEKAYHFYKRNRQIADSTLSAEKHRQIAELETKYQTERKNREISELQKNNEIHELTLAQQNQQLRFNRVLIFVLVILLSLGGFLAFYIHKWNVSKHQNVRNQLEIKNLKTEQRMLKSQMNPHFVFNSLNSIQSFIISNQTHQATKYLANFAKLIRGFLENSRSDSVLLDKEIEQLKLYTELEQLRFENRFTVEFVVDDDVESDFISIPPMVIQPFIENAILHGFTGKEKGHITVQFSMDSENMLVSVDDNGIGRKASTELKTDSQKKSLAMQITQERLDSISEQYKTKAGFTIIDKTDTEKNLPAGTRVEIVIPIVS